MDSERRQFADFLRDARLRCHLTQMEAGRRLGYRNGQFISNMERACCLPPLKKMKRFVALYGLERDEVYYLLSRLRDRELRAGLGIARKHAMPVSLSRQNPNLY